MGRSRKQILRNFLAYWLIVVASYAVVGLLRVHGSARGVWEWVWPNRSV